MNMTMKRRRASLVAVLWFSILPDGSAAQDNARLREQVASCERGNLADCNAVGVAADNAGLAAQALPYFQKVCNGGEPVGCSNLGELYFDGRGVTQDRAVAMQLFRSACQGVHTSGCAGVCVSWFAAGSLSSQLLGSCTKAVQASCDQGNAHAGRLGKASLAAPPPARSLTPPPARSLTPPPAPATRGVCSDAAAKLLARAYFLSNPFNPVDDLVAFVRQNRSAFQRGNGPISCGAALGPRLVRAGIGAYDPGAYEKAMGAGPAEHAPEVARSINSGAVELFSMGQELSWLVEVLPDAANENWQPFLTTGTETRQMLRDAMGLLQDLATIPDFAESLGFARGISQLFAPIAEEQILMLARMMPR
jgi:hypothetical protein